MSKTLTFADGVSYNIDDASSIDNIIILVDTFAKIDDIKKEFTQDNLTGAMFGDEKLTDIVPVSIQTFYDIDSDIIVHLHSRKLTEIEIANAQITELQEAIAEIAG